jgi:AraC family transcriptional regulator, regulatory protein of adaptative response / methylated-DNA-[protein]-cysteine methyltransferase
MTPASRAIQNGNEVIHFAIRDCSLGLMLVAFSGKGVCCLTLGDDADYLLEDLKKRFRNAEFVEGDAGFEKVVGKVVGFVDAPERSFDLPLDIRGTAFQQRVWQALLEIPHGSTVSYGELAEKIGSPKSVRAVAGACGANSISIAIPCHRVVRADGGLSGYRWGVERKRALLDRETIL